jgi:hypothetical protein
VPEPGNQSPPEPYVFELHGDYFMLRAVDRANKKFKPKYDFDL